MVSTKNELQEIWQAHGDKLPTYVTTRLGGLDHSPVYRSVVILPDQTSFTGETSSTRTGAELAAADLAIPYSASVKPERPKAYRNVVGQHNSYVFIDIENIPKAITLGNYIGHERCVGFVSSKHPMAHMKKQNDMELYVIQSHERDAADIALVMSMAMYASRQEFGKSKKCTRLIVLTKDHFGAAVVDVIRQWWPELDVYHAVTLQDVIENVK